MSSKGFLIFAQGSEYVRQAYALALSIKLSQSIHNSVSIITNDVVPDKYKLVFDNIIEIPWNDESTDSEWKVENRWKLIHASPYDETIVLDSDMIFFKDISGTWDRLKEYDLFFANNVIDYKGRKINDVANRKTFIENNLPSVYFALHYFKKTPTAFNFYKMLEFVVHNWQACYGKFTPLSYQNWVSMDVSAAISVLLLDLESRVTNDNIDFTFVHMKPNAQGWSPAPSSWVDTSNYYVTDDLELYINQFKQTGIFHYTEDKFLTEQVIKFLEDKYDN
jgi:hypothetical protein